MCGTDGERYPPECLLVIGCSAGGLRAMQRLFANLPVQGGYAVLVAYHMQEESGEAHVENLRKVCPWPVATAHDKETVEAGKVLFAPPGYHMCVEPDRSISLSVEERIQYSRPSIDILFQSAARCWRQNLCALVLTGANEDGAEGAREVAAAGGAVFIQDPRGADFRFMPETAISRVPGAKVRSLPDLESLMMDPFSTWEQYNKEKGRIP